MVILEQLSDSQNTYDMSQVNSQNLS